MDVQIYSEKQLKDVKIILTILLLRKKYKQSIFVFDRTTNLQLSKMQSEIYESLVTIQYHAECIKPLFIYRMYTNNKIRVYIFCCKLVLLIA